MYNIDIIDNKLRKLAKSNYWQNLYNASKNCANIQLFKNTYDFSGLQIKFIHYLSIYSMLFEELMKHEDDRLTENVINDNDRVDAYLIYRNKKHDGMWKKYRYEEKLSDHKSHHPKKHRNAKTNLIDVDLRRE